MTNLTDNRIYFSGLNSLRFFAALAVIITHIELLKGSFGFKSYWKNPLIFNLGGLGVYFFFVLSGFLITYLLLAEKEKYKKIEIKKFYLRRILRIWPLYYLIITIGFFILPHFECFQIQYLQENFEKNFNENLLLYILILPNLAFSIFTAVPNIGQVWSIGVEEQFYLFWPWLISKSKNILKTLIIIIVGLFFLKVIVLVIGYFYSDTKWYTPLKLFVAMSKFECMSIGGIGAYLLFSDNKYIQKIHSNLILATVSICIPLLIYLTPSFLQDGVHIVYSVLFLIIILNIINGKFKRILECKLFTYLGKISYGIYMYHFMIIPLILFIFKTHLNIGSDFLLNTLIYASCILTTIMISSLSYYFIEIPFIKIKSKYSPVVSG